MRKLLIPIFFVLASLWPCTSQAITQTTSFTLSVTIPERAGISANDPKESVSRNVPSTQSVDLGQLVQVDEGVRDNQVVLLESYVTK